MRFYLEVLGCPKNLYDAQFLVDYLLKKGFEFTFNPEDADFIIVSTCTFIEPATRESIERIIELGEIKRGKLFVTGCMPERYRENLLRELPEIDGIMGTCKVEKIDELLSGKRAVFGKKGFLPAWIPENLLTPPHYVYIKISEGCSHRCSFCIIPSLKGKYRSRRMEDILHEIGELPPDVREIILVGQDTSKWGKELGLSPQRLLEEISKIFHGWIRVMYLHPLTVDEELLKCIRDFTVGYVDIPFQHVSDRVLRSMRRGYGRRRIEKILEVCKKLGLCIRTTFIVGYPEETERDFEELKKFLEDAEFDRVGFFMYYHEEGTYAERNLPDLPLRVKRERKREVERIQEGIMRKKHRELVGRVFEVLVDGIKGKRGVGRTRMDAPDIDCEVKIDGEVEIGEFYRVEITRSSAFTLYGRLREEGNKATTPAT